LEISQGEYTDLLQKFLESFFLKFKINLIGSQFNQSNYLLFEFVLLGYLKLQILMQFGWRGDTS
jgi:hypothetical protein